MSVTDLIVLGHTEPLDAHEPLARMPLTSRLQGLYCLGKNGTGKSTFLLSLIVQDLAAGRGVCVLDPHGDLTTDILDHVEAFGREHDVVLLDLRESERPFGLNLFHCLNPSDPIRIAETVARVMEVFAKVFDVGPHTPRLARFLRNIVLTLIETNLTMLEINPLLTDVDFRSMVVGRIGNADVRRFWTLFEALPDRDKPELIESTLNRVDAFTAHPLVRTIVGQIENSVDWRRAMDTGQVVLVKLDNQLAEPTAVLGGVIVGQLLDAALSRKDLPQADRRPFMLYADEYQRFATPSFGTLFDEGRKYGIATTIAHQRRDQLDEANRGAPLGAVNLVLFQITGQDAEELAKQFRIDPAPVQMIPKIVTEPVYKTWTEDVWDPPSAQAEYIAARKELEAAKLQYALLEGAFTRARNGGDEPSGARFAWLWKGNCLDNPLHMHRPFNPDHWERIRFESPPDIVERERSGRERWRFPLECLSRIEIGLIEKTSRSDATAFELLNEVRVMLRPYKQQATYWFTPDPDYRHGREPYGNSLGRATFGRWEITPFPEALAWVLDRATALAREIARLTPEVERLVRCHTTVTKQSYLYDRPVRDVATSAVSPTGSVELQRYRWEPGPDRSYADIQNEIANRLATLPPFTAMVGIRRDNDLIEYRIRPLVTAAHGKRFLPRSVGRTRAEVEMTIRQRQTLVLPSVLDRDADANGLQTPQHRPPRPPIKRFSDS